MRSFRRDTMRWWHLLPAAFCSKLPGLMATIIVVICLCIRCGRLRPAVPCSTRSRRRWRAEPMLPDSLATSTAKICRGWGGLGWGRRIRLRLGLEFTPRRMSLTTGAASLRAKRQTNGLWEMLRVPRALRFGMCSSELARKVTAKRLRRFRNIFARARPIR